MAKLYNLAGMSTATTGTGTITLGSALYGHLTFAQAGVQDGDTVGYAVKDGAASEVGYGVYAASGPTLTRTVRKSTNSGAAISLSGSAEVFITPAAEDIIPRLSSTTDNTVPRHDGTAGLLQTSGVTIDDSNNVTGVAGLTLSGNIGVKTTPSATFAVDVNGSADYATMRIKAPNGPLLQFSGSYNSGNGAQLFQLDTGVFYFAVNPSSPTITMTPTSKVGFGVHSPAYQLHLSTDSAAKPSTNTWTISSDERLKTDVVAADLARCWEIVSGIPLKHYRWKPEAYAAGAISDQSKLGWIAQDVAPFFEKSTAPTVHTYPDGTTLDDCLTLNSDQLYAAMYGALQLAMQKVDALESRTEFVSGGATFAACRAEKDRAALLITAAQTAVIQGAQAGDYRWFDSTADFTIDDASGVPVQMDAIAAFAYCNALLRAII